MTGGRIAQFPVLLAGNISCRTRDRAVECSYENNVALKPATMDGTTKKPFWSGLGQFHMRFPPFHNDQNHLLQYFCVIRSLPIIE